MDAHYRPNTGTLICPPLFLTLLLHKPELTKIESSHEYVQRERKKLGKWRPGEKNTVVAFWITVALWIAPGVLALIYGSDAPISEAYAKFMPEGVAALIGAGLLFCCR